MISLLVLLFLEVNMNVLEEMGYEYKNGKYIKENVVIVPFGEKFVYYNNELDYNVTLNSVNELIMFLDM